MARQYVLARVTDMRGVDLRRFEFDYDLTWAAFFLDTEGRVLGRFGGRDAASPDSFLTLPGLKHAMDAQLSAFRRGVVGAEPPRETEDGVVRPEEYPSAKRKKADACIHCHEVYHFRMDFHRERGSWNRDRIWTYPPPENLGLVLDPKRQDRLVGIKPQSPAARIGLRAGDVITQVNGVRIASFADVLHALHRSPITGKIPVRWQRDGLEVSGHFELPGNWRESDISWRESMWHLEPVASVYGGDLTPAEKAALGLEPNRLAFRQSQFVPPIARAAGIQSGDVVLGIRGKKLEMTMLQFNAWVRLNYRVGEMIEYEVMRDGKRFPIRIKLPGR